MAAIVRSANDRAGAFCISRIATGSKVRVKFARLNPSDWRELLDQATAWGQSDYVPFFEVWSENDEWRDDIRKVVLTTGSDRRMQGLVYLASAGPFWPEGCVLIAAPWNRYDYELREFSGVGTALVAYLVVESKRRGRNGALRFQIDPDAQAFYVSLGFTAISPAIPDYYALEPIGAENILLLARCPSFRTGRSSQLRNSRL